MSQAVERGPTFLIQLVQERGLRLVSGVNMGFWRIKWVGSAILHRRRLDADLCTFRGL